MLLNDGLPRVLCQVRPIRAEPTELQEDTPRFVISFQVVIPVGFCLSTGQLGRTFRVPCLLVEVGRQGVPIFGHQTVRVTRPVALPSCQTAMKSLVD